MNAKHTVKHVICDNTIDIEPKNSRRMQYKYNWIKTKSIKNMITIGNKKLQIDSQT